MRQDPSDTGQFIGNDVFSNDVWGTAAVSFTPYGNESENESDISRYAATTIPQANTPTAQSTRYGLSPHSSQYEPSKNLTNSQSDPFTHPAYDGDVQTVELPQVNRNLLPQNARYETMPAPARQYRTGEPIPAAPVHDVIPEPAAPPAHTTLPSSFDSFGASAPEVVQPDIPLSDFEEEFRVAQNAQPHIDEVVDLTVLEQTNLPAYNTSTTSPQAIDQLSYPTGYSGFDQTHYNDFYADSADSREPLHIDIEFLTRTAKKLLRSKIFIAVVIVLIALTAFLALKPSSGPKAVPAKTEAPVKTIVTPQVTVEEPVLYDADGNPVTDIPTNSNFDG